MEAGLIERVTVTLDRETIAWFKSQTGQQLQTRHGPLEGQTSPRRGEKGSMAARAAGGPRKRAQEDFRPKRCSGPPQDTPAAASHGPQSAPERDKGYPGHPAPERGLKSRCARSFAPQGQGLFSRTTLAAQLLRQQRPSAHRTAAWHAKPLPAFVDAIALVPEGFSLSAADPDIRKVPAALYHRLVDSLAYAA